MENLLPYWHPRYDSNYVRIMNLICSKIQWFHAWNFRKISLLPSKLIYSYFSTLTYYQNFDLMANYIYNYHSSNEDCYKILLKGSNGPIAARLVHSEEC